MNYNRNLISINCCHDNGYKITASVQCQHFFQISDSPGECNSWWHLDHLIRIYRKVSSIRRTKSQNLNASRLILWLSLPNPLKPVSSWEWRCSWGSADRRLSASYIRDLTVHAQFPGHDLWSVIKGYKPRHTWRRQYMETLSALQALCDGNLPVNGRFST